MIDGSEKRNRQLAFELQNSHVCEKRGKLRNWIIPKYKLARLLVTHDGGKLTRVGDLSLAERLQGR